MTGITLWGKIVAFNKLCHKDRILFKIMKFVFNLKISVLGFWEFYSPYRVSPKNKDLGWTLSNDTLRSKITEGQTLLFLCLTRSWTFLSESLKNSENLGLLKSKPIYFKTSIKIFTHFVWIFSHFVTSCHSKPYAGIIEPTCFKIIFICICVKSITWWDHKTWRSETRYSQLF